MAKFTLALFLVAALLVTSQAYMPTTPRRALQQTFTCSQAKALNGRCAELLTCIVGRAPSLKSMSATINSMCNNCVAATKTCPANNALPAACSQGMRFPPVAACITAAASAKPAAKVAAKPAAKPASG